MIAVVVSAAVVVAGLYLLLVPDAAGFAAFGWVFVVLGAVGVVGNLVLRARTRGTRPRQRPGRRP